MSTCMKPPPLVARMRDAIEATHRYDRWLARHINAIADGGVDGTRT
jgi:hypothetical protein